MLSEGSPLGIAWFTFSVCSKGVGGVPPSRTWPVSVSVGYALGSAVHTGHYHTVEGVPSQRTVCCFKISTYISVSSEFLLNRGLLPFCCCSENADQTYYVKL